MNCGYITEIFYYKLDKYNSGSLGIHMKNNISAKLSAIAISVLLASCGGGGSDGYYGGGNTGGGTGGEPTTPQPVATNYHLMISANKPSVVITGDTAVVTVKLVDVNGGGVASQNVTLAVEDTVNNGITIEGPSTLVTDESGNAHFTLQLNAANVADKAALLSKGLRLNATFTDATKKVTSQTALIKVIEALTSETSTAQYFLSMSSNKPTLVVTGDSAKVTIKAFDVNGGGVAGQNVTLAIVDTLKNGVTIAGPSKGVTDYSGNITFTIALPKSTGSIATALIANGITLNAELTDANGVTSKQSTKLSVTAAEVAQPIGNITFGTSSELEKSSDANYYSEAASAHVVDINGKPLANQTVTLSLKVIHAGQGEYYLKKSLNNAKNADVFALETQAAAYPDDSPAKKRIEALISALNSFELPGRDRNYCGLTDLSKTQLATGFVSSTGQINPTFTYTTDSVGKFDFRINYLRRYAGWQAVEITATTGVSGKTLQSSMNYQLGLLKEDADSESSQPFDTSPYGKGSCTYNLSST